MSLDINTPKGQVSLSQEQQLIAAIENNYAGYQVIQTPKSLDAEVDGILCKGAVMVGVIENKCRDMSLATLKRFGNEWLLTFEKINKGALLARSLRIPFIGYLYLVPDGIALAIKLSDENGNLLPKIRIERTKTQATTNGGHAVRTNAYVCMDDAKSIRVTA